MEDGATSETKRLRATDPAHFPEDPLRGLRVAGFAARFEMAPDAELKRLCSELDLSELSAERVFAELEKLLLRSEKPSIGFELLRETKLLRFFPEVEALVGVPQEPDWHPEGDVWIHTMMVLDEAAKLRTGSVDEDLALMYGALAHDFGKPSTTRTIGGRITSYEHDVKGVFDRGQRFSRSSARRTSSRRKSKRWCAIIWRPRSSTRTGRRRKPIGVSRAISPPRPCRRISFCASRRRIISGARRTTLSREGSPPASISRTMMESLELTLRAPERRRPRATPRRPRPSARVRSSAGCSRSAATCRTRRAGTIRRRFWIGCSENSL